MIKTYKQAKDYLDSFINYEKRVNFVYKKALKSERVYFLLDYLGIAYQNLKVIHIAGTKGKGSTANFCAHLLVASGFKTGLYTSPHFFDFRERIEILSSRQSAVQSNVIGKNEVTKIVKEIATKLSKLKIPKELGGFSFFEVYTAIAFKYFLEKGVNFVVLETGLGGRLDATNVVKPLVSIITHIGYDHTDKLGKKLGDIAGEKAGIIKPGVPVVCAGQRPVSLERVKQKAKQKASPLVLLGRDIKARNVRVKDGDTCFDFNFRETKLKNLKIYLKGRHQVDNACLALAAIILLKEKGVIENKLDLKQGLRSCRLEGRFVAINKFPLTVVDVAHNVSSFFVLGNSLGRYFPGKKVILVFSCSKDKDAKNMLKRINYSYLILTSFFGPRSYEPQNLKKVCGLRKAFIAKDIKEAYKQAKKVYDRGWLIVISGSFFLVGEAKKLISAEKAH